MYKIVAQDSTGQQLDQIYVMVKPTDKTLNSFLREVKKQFKVMVKVSFFKLKYIDMGAL